ncbi:hypothetical protein LSTR_LSTR002514 [Laodelphax striatellus]|uniref:PiggyBac transposable element-derived protein domain-containing protein n=1 Tax=Laodelphax striatellus TaxID=195883 RepID=A0A482X4B6_LAOST|nr:hypothetical protein LSTR_LSTR002514 [Laodelphax striatellus]
MCWKSRTRYPLIADNISRDRFFTLRSKLKIVDDNNVSLAEKASNPYWKVQPMLDRVKRGCLQNHRPENILSILIAYVEQLATSIINLPFGKKMSYCPERLPEGCAVTARWWGESWENVIYEL